MKQSWLSFMLWWVLKTAIVNGHSWLAEPGNRGGVLRSSGYRFPWCRKDLSQPSDENCLGPCEAPKDDHTPTFVSIKRGQVLQIVWERANHPGGWVRLAWAPWSDSDKHEAFHERVQKYTCFETGGCHSTDFPNNPTGGGLGSCTTYLQVPSWLSDGKWTLQWTWYGGIATFSDYYTCNDFEITGGDAYSSDKPNPIFNGGDVHNPEKQVCAYANTRYLGVCLEEPCDINRNYPRSILDPGTHMQGAVPLKGFSTQEIVIGPVDATLVNGELVANWPDGVPKSVTEAFSECNPTASCCASSGCSYHEKTTLAGVDIRTAFRLDSKEECCQECKKESLCMAWEYSFGYCKLKKSGYSIKETNTQYGELSGVVCKVSSIDNPPVNTVCNRDCGTHGECITNEICDCRDNYHGINCQNPPETESTSPTPALVPTLAPTPTQSLAPTPPTPKPCPSIDCGDHGYCNDYNINDAGTCQLSSQCLEGIAESISWLKENRQDLTCEDMYRIATKDNGQNNDHKNCAGDTDETSYFLPTYKSCWKHIKEIGNQCSFWNTCICEQGYSGSNCEICKLCPPTLVPAPTTEVASPTLFSDAIQNVNFAYQCVHIIFTLLFLLIL